MKKEETDALAVLVREQIHMAGELSDDLEEFGARGVTRAMVLDALACAGVRLAPLDGPNVASIAYLHLCGYPIGGD